MDPQPPPPSSGRQLRSRAPVNYAASPQEFRQESPRPEEGSEPKPQPRSKKGAGSSSPPPPLPLPNPAPGTEKRVGVGFYIQVDVDELNRVEILDCLKKLLRQFELTDPVRRSRAAYQLVVEEWQDHIRNLEAARGPKAAEISRQHFNSVRQLIDENYDELYLRPPPPKGHIQYKEKTDFAHPYLDQLTSNLMDIEDPGEDSIKNRREWFQETMHYSERREHHRGLIGHTPNPARAHESVARRYLPFEEVEKEEEAAVRDAEGGDNFN